MNRYVVSMALALLLTGGEALAGQTAARIDYRNGRIGVSVAIGDLPVRIRPQARVAVGWGAVDWGPVRVWAAGARPAWRREILNRQELRYLLGHQTVKQIERHGRNLGVHGPLEGRWFRVDRYTTLLEVGVRGVPVAELYDYGNDGLIDRIFLSQPYRAAPGHGVIRYKEGYVKRGRGNGKKRW